MICAVIVRAPEMHWPVSRGFFALFCLFVCLFVCFTQDVIKIAEESVES